MDYRGQKLCEYLYSIIIIAFAIISFIVGYIKSDFYITIVGWAAGSVLAFIVSYYLLYIFTYSIYLYFIFLF